jgi:uncharacterized protein DUF1566
MTARSFGAPLSAMLISAFLTVAVSAPAQADVHPPFVISATVDYTQKTLTITGQNFGSTPTITLGPMTLTTKPPASGSLIVGSFPSNMPPSSLAAGTYFLTVRFTNQYPAVFVVDIDPDGAAGPRYVANGDGTVTDNKTGLMWEMKTGTVGAPNTSDVHDVNNRHTWGPPVGTSPNGTLFTTFLATLNGGDYYNPTDMLDESAGPGTCFANHCDWRIPTVVELQILLAPCPGGTSPCIDPTFGPTQGSAYWSFSSVAGSPNFAWFVSFFFGGVGSANDFKNRDYYARAVRGGR